MKDRKLLLMKNYFLNEKWIMLESNLKQLDCQEKALFFYGITEKSQNTDKINKWLKNRNASNFSLIAKAYQHINKGWEYRRGGLASTVSNKSWELFYQELGKAVSTFTLVKSNSDESIDVATGFLHMSQASILSTEEYQWAHKILNLKGKNIVIAHLDVLNSLTPKWGGSIEDMENYIEQQKNSIKVYSCLIASKHIELWLNLGLDLEDDNLNPYFNNPAPLQELTQVFSGYSDSFSTPTLIDFYILNYFTVAFYLAKEYNYANQCINNLEGRYINHPWGYLGESLFECHDTNYIVSRIAKQLKAAF